MSYYLLPITGVPVFTSFMKMLRFVSLFCLLCVAAVAADVRVATLNCYMFFKPGIDHRGQLDDKNPLTVDQYEKKIANLLTLVRGFDVVGIQEAGGRDEIEDLARGGGYQWAFSKGKDTYTGQEVGLLYRFPAKWKVAVKGRVAALDGVVSKHLLVTATDGVARISFLVVHLIRPIGQNAAKHQRQLDAIGAWAREQSSMSPGGTILIIGDTNNPDSVPGSSIYGIGTEVADLLGDSATHLNGKCYDRIALVGAGAFRAPEIRRPSYGKRPNNTLLRVWTDHALVGATVHTP